MNLMRHFPVICVKLGAAFLLRDALQCKARSCYRLSSVCLSVRPSVTLVDHNHIG